MAYSDRANPPNIGRESIEQCVWSDDLKLIWNLQNDVYQVFDIAKDPEESRNIFDPSVEDHQGLLSLLALMNSEVSELWKTAEKPVEKEKDFGPLQQEFHAAVKKLEAASNPAELRKSILKLRQVLSSPQLAWRRRLNSRGSAR